MDSLFLIAVMLTIVLQGILADDVKSRIKIAECRATCLDKFADKKVSDASCKEKPDCFMCWETCELLLTNYNVWGHMCGVPQICFPGCQSSCYFYQNGNEVSRNKEIKELWSFKNEFNFNVDDKSGSVTLEWLHPESKKSQPIGQLVYVLMSRNEIDSQWKEIKQTADLKSTFNRPHNNFQLKIGAITAGGLLTQKIVEYTEKGQEKMSLDDHMTSGASRSASAWWIPQLLSLHHGTKQSGVDAIITWTPREESSRYEVTWRVIDDAMEITGHLYTVRNLATLTLWPNALYSVQVRCFGKQGEALSVSKALLVDTHGFPQTESNQITQKECFDFRQTVLLTSCIGGLVLLVAVTVLLCICRRCQSVQLQHVTERPTEAKTAVCPTEQQKAKCSRKPSTIILQTSNEIKSNLNKLKREFSHKTADTEPLTPACHHEEDGVEENNSCFFAFELPCETQKGKPGDL